MPNRVIRTSFGQERAFGIHSEDRLLGGKSNVKRDMRIFGDRGDPALAAAGAP